MNKFNNRQAIFHLLQKWLTTSLFTVVVSYFVLRLLGFRQAEMSYYIPRAFIFCALLGFLIEFWRYSLPGAALFILILAVQWLTGFDLKVPFLSLEFWFRQSDRIIQAFRWAITLNSIKGPVPAGFPLIFILIVSGVATLTNWLLPIPLLNMFLLIAPMFYLDDLSTDKIWIAYLLIGLFCVYSSYAFRQDPSNREQRPPLLFGTVLIGLTFLLQSLFSPQSFFNPELSQVLNSISPTEGGEINSFSLKELGFYPQGNLRVGGPVKLSDDPYMTVQAPATAFYLRGSAYDHFDGHSWSLSEPQYLESYEWPSDYFEDFTSRMASIFWFTDRQSRDLALTEMIFQPMLYSIETAEPNRIIFHGGKPVWLSKLTGPIPKNTAAEEIIDRYSGGGKFFYSEIGMLVGADPYDQNGLAILDSVVPVLNNWTTELGKETFSLVKPVRGEAKNELRELVARDDPKLYDIIYKKNLAFDQLIKEMRAHFDRYYQYKLDVPEIPNDQLFMDHFLQLRKGYCVYFATAWSQLLKDIGYETRYVEGFIVPQYTAKTPEEVDQTLHERIITAKTAHAWVEVKLEGIGWYPIEATPSDYLSGISNTIPYKHIQKPALEESTPIPEESSEESAEQSSESLSSEESTDISSDESSAQTSDEHAENDPTDSLRFDYLLPVILFLMLILILALFIRHKIKQHNRRMSANSLIQSPLASADLVARLWGHILRLNRSLGKEDRPEETIRQLINRFTEDEPETDPNTLQELFNKVYYGRCALSEEELIVLHNYYVSLENRVKSKSSRLSYLINHVLRVSGNPW